MQIACCDLIQLFPQYSLKISPSYTNNEVIVIHAVIVVAGVLFVPVLGIVVVLAVIALTKVAAVVF